MIKIHIRGEESRCKELEATLPEGIDAVYNYQESESLEPGELEGYDLLIHLNMDELTEEVEHYLAVDTPKIFSAVKSSLSSIMNYSGGDLGGPLAGINALPGFIDRPLKEMSFYHESHHVAMKEVLEALGWQYQVVDDRVGMVTPRIVCMIINEACYTLQEGTASMEDIDLSMKLGTNYPKGPFEWGDEMGVTEVYEVLEAVYEDTKDERYKICPLLQTKYLRWEPFYESEQGN